MSNPRSSQLPTTNSSVDHSNPTLLGSCFCLLVLLLASAASGQVVRERANAVVTIAELQAEVLATEAGVLEVQSVLEAANRAEAYRDVDLARGDRIVALNGRLLRSLADLEAAYAAMGLGETLEFGIQRGDQRWIERFAKADPADLPRVRRMRIEGNPEDLALLLEVGVIFSREDGELRVTNLLPVGPASEEFRVGDRLVAFNGSEDLEPAQLQQLWQLVPVGTEVEFVLRRGDDPVTVTVAKPEGHPGQRRVVRQ